MAEDAELVLAPSQESFVARAGREIKCLPGRYFRSIHSKAAEYQVNPRIFWGLYLFSFLPYHAGIYLMLSGSGVVSFKLHSFLHFDFQHIDLTRGDVLLGLFINRFAWLMPYLYVEIFGRNVPWFLHAAIWIWIAICFAIAF
jgi:hypothetical protein